MEMYIEEMEAMVAPNDIWIKWIRDIKMDYPFVDLTLNGEPWPY